MYYIYRNWHAFTLRGFASIARFSLYCMNVKNKLRYLQWTYENVCRYIHVYRDILLKSKSFSSFLLLDMPSFNSWKKSDVCSFESWEWSVCLGNIWRENSRKYMFLHGWSCVSVAVGVVTPFRGRPAAYQVGYCSLDPTHCMHWTQDLVS